MSKQKLRCKCITCGEEFELEADMLIPGVEGHMNLAEGSVSILDPTKERRCDICTMLLIEALGVGESSE
jgi:hypothetical protein